MHQMLEQHTSPITLDWLTSRTFTFKVEPSGPILSEQFAFHRNGFITGYSHGNESYWELEGEGINILDRNGRVTCHLARNPASQDKFSFSGHFQNPRNGYEKTETVHVIEENDSDYHAKIQSFDLFDTLVARRCFAPLEVFRAIEIKSGVKNFAFLRHRAEMSIFGQRPYGLDDVYELLISQSVLTPKRAEVLKLMELEEEWGNLFQISEVVARVNPDDIIISDMYLPLPFIERVVREKCGLNNKVYLSNYGKHSRQIWPEILEKHQLRGHFGDNIQADILSPSGFGIPVNLVSISKWDQSEETLHKAGLPQFAHALRETRLQTFHPDPRVQNAVRAQIAINIPLMILGAFWVRYCAQKHAADKILMASRDCNLWHELVSSKHFARCGMPASSYVQISRTVCHDESVEYEAYLQSKLGQRSLLVDMVGTGNSLGAIVERMGRQDAVTPCILVGEPASIDLAGSYPEALITKEFFRYRIFVEALNASREGTTVGAVYENHSLTIRNQENEFGDAFLGIVAEMRKAFARFLSTLDNVSPPTELPSLEALRSAADAIAELIPAHAEKLSTLHHEQILNLARGRSVSAVVA
jgi:hypothetical protein